jgi:hypothetical protein
MRDYTRRAAVIVLVCLGVACASPAAPPPPATAAPAPILSSWNDGPSKQALTAFVTRVTTAGTPDFVPVPERLAVFDNDGTLWAEQPMYAQLAFALDRVKALAPQHPEWAAVEPFKSVLAGDLKSVMAGGEHALMQILAATHAGTTTAEFDQIVTAWVTTAKHPTKGRLYTELVYQPMLEVLDYLRANGFKTYIVSGGGLEFMRPWAERVYGIPPEQVIGSRSKMRYELRDGVPVLARLAEIDLVDDKAGKPVGIQQVIGRRPTIAFGNSDGDFEMLEWTTTAPGPRLAMIVHHTDAEREWAYDRESSVGRLVRGLDEAAQRRWVVVDMKQEWKKIWP